MGTSFINDSEHWHNRAEEVGTLADQMNDDESKQMMLRIAADYLRTTSRLRRSSKTRHQKLALGDRSRKWGIPLPDLAHVTGRCRRNPAARPIVSSNPCAIYLIGMGVCSFPSE
jgi:hypothetical protein